MDNVGLVAGFPGPVSVAVDTLSVAGGSPWEGGLCLGAVLGGCAWGLCLGAVLGGCAWGLCLGAVLGGCAWGLCLGAVGARPARRSSPRLHLVVFARVVPGGHRPALPGGPERPCLAASPEPRAPSPEPRAPSPEPRAPSAEPRAPSPERRAPSAEPRAPSPEPRAPSPEPRAVAHRCRRATQQPAHRAQRGFRLPGLAPRRAGSPAPRMRRHPSTLENHRPTAASTHQTCQVPSRLRSSRGGRRPSHRARLFGEVTGYGGSP
ncbi:hypothetical protein SAMN04489730_8053 [Amycolatopsis australiensis]|uniref:Uncharacterized protein n=1 Tax=Amycolatopsis australiensis TaxID=546364 RepID=A0A1K1T509_9PSEU|nr:hypothetical protein SAMN04489730_8053 [Amycolatopsis australiensis]